MDAVVVWNWRTLTVAPCIVEALAASVCDDKLKSVGRIRTDGLSADRHWRSTLPIAETEHVLREGAKREGRRVTFFLSQAV